MISKNTKNKEVIELDLTWEELEEQKIANQRKKEYAEGKTARKKYI